MIRIGRWAFGPAARKEHEPHRGAPVRVGEFQIFLGGTAYLSPYDLRGYDMVIPFVEEEKLPVWLESVASPKKVRRYPIPDFSAPPADWPDFVNEVAQSLKQGQKVMGFCVGGHGRTGTFLASLIAVLEPDVRDPIAEARSRYCGHAVEISEQAGAVFALKGKPLPKKYR